MKSKYLVILSFALLGVTEIMFSQSDASIKNDASLSKCNVKGTVNLANASIDYYNVVILSALDSAYIKGEVFYDSSFIINDIAQKDFLVQISSMSMVTKTMHVNRKDNETSVNLGAILAEGKMLKEVTVIANSKMVNQSSSGTVLNIANSPLAQSGSAIDVLRKSPGLLVDKDNKVQVFGKGNAKIYIDGREATSNELSELSSENILKVEVIKNPSAKYEASANAVVNITTKNRARDGYYVKHTSNFTKGDFYRYAGDLDLSMKTDNLELFSFISTKEQKIKFVDNYFREIQLKEDQIYMENELVKERKDHLPISYKLGTNYNINNNNRISLVFSGSYSDGSSLTNNINEVHYPQQSSLFNTRTNSTSLSKRNLVTFGYSSNLDSAGQKIDVKVDYLKINQNWQDNISEMVTNTNSVNYLKRNDNANNIDIVSGVADYVYPVVPTHTRINAGVKVTDMKNKSENIFSKYEDTWITDPSKSDYSSYNENNLAGYVMLNQHIKSLDLNIGLRGENSEMEGNHINRSYFDLFPSASVDYQISKLMGASLSYSKRVQRPTYQDLNPYLIYIDSLSYSKGNPNLRPSMSNAFDFAINYRKLASLNFSYTKTESPMFMYVETDVANHGATYVSTKNFDKSERYSITLNLPYELNVWTTYNSFGWTYDKVDYNNGSNNIDILAKSKSMYYVYAYNNFKLPKKFSFYFTYQYYTGGINGILEFKAKHLVNVGLMKELGKNVKVHLQYNDLFNKEGLNAKAVIPNMNLKYRAQSDASYIRLSVTLNFGGNFKVENIKSGIREEMNRVKEN
jgi:outer membrane receptor protein involved in Fe transport